MQRDFNDIIPPSRRRALGAEAPARPDVPPTIQRVPPREPRERRPGRKFPVYTAAIAGIAVLGSIGALFAFADASVNVTPTRAQSQVSGEFIASATEGDLTFEVLTVEKVAAATVPSEGTETVNESAQGTIVISNRQDVPQQLIKNTRFETPDGLIFRIRDSVTIPAEGTLSATVYADATGEAYNVPATTFTVPGLAGTSAFDQVTAASSEPMRGGFAGERASVSDETREEQSAAARRTLETQIDAALAAAVPEGYALLPGASRVEYEPQPDAEGSGDTVEISEKAVATAVIFPNEALARAIAYQTVGSYAGQPVTLERTEGLTLTPVGDIPVPGTTEFAFSLAGNAAIRWSVDEAKVAGAVAGKSRDAAGTVISGFPEIASAEFVLRPFWSGSFPQDPKDIDVKVAGAED